MFLTICSTGYIFHSILIKFGDAENIKVYRYIDLCKNAKRVLEISERVAYVSERSGDSAYL